MRRRGPVAWLSRTPRQPVPGWREVHASALVVAHRDLTELEAEVERLRSTTELTTAGAVMAELRAQRAERELAALRGEVAGLRAELAALREELVWAYAADTRTGWPAARPAVIDLTGPRAATA